MQHRHGLAKAQPLGIGQVAGNRPEFFERGLGHAGLGWIRSSRQPDGIRVIRGVFVVRLSQDRTRREIVVVWLFAIGFFRAPRLRRRHGRVRQRSDGLTWLARGTTKERSKPFGVDTQRRRPGRGRRLPSGRRGDKHPSGRRIQPADNRLAGHHVRGGRLEVQTDGKRLECIATPRERPQRQIKAARVWLAAAQKSQRSGHQTRG